MNKHPKFQFNEILDLLIEFVYLAIIFIIPLYFSLAFPTYNIFELSKLAIFQALVCVLLFLTLAKLVFYWPFNFSGNRGTKRALVLFKRYGAVPLVFIVGLGITLIFSTNRIQSFFGSYDRQAGYLSYIFYFLWFILLAFNIRTINNRVSRLDAPEKISQRVDRLISVAVISSFLVSVYGILQILGMDFLTWPEDPLLTRRTISTFGQPNFLASWLVMAIPLSAYLIFKNKKFLLRVFFGIILLSQLACLFFTSSRGALVALAVILVFYIFYLIFFVKLKRLYKILASIIFALAIIFGVFILNYILPGRITSLFNAQSGSTAARLNFYSAASDSIIEKPLFGYGLENSGEVFIKYYLPDWGIHGDVGATTDRAHNLILDILLTSGVFGLLLFSALYYYFFRLGFKNIREGKMSALSMALALGAAAYLLSLLFSFTIVGGEIYFWLFLALQTAINLGPKNETVNTDDMRARISFLPLRILALIIIFLIMAGGVYYEFKILVADHYFNRLYYTLGEKQYFAAFLLDDYTREEKANYINQEYYNQFLGDKLSDFYPNLTELVVKRTAADKLRELDKQLNKNSYENIFVKAKINSVLGNYQLAESYFRDVITASPYWPKTYIELARMFTYEKKYKEALINYQLALSNLPDLNDKRFNEMHRGILKLYRKLIFREIGDIYFAQEKYLEAEQSYQQAYRSDINDFTLLKKIADTYYRRHDFKTALEYNERGLARNPGDYNWALALAVINKQLGNSEIARSFLEAAIKLAPEEAWLIKLRAEY